MLAKQDRPRTRVYFGLTAYSRHSVDRLRSYYLSAGAFSTAPLERGE